MKSHKGDLSVIIAERLSKGKPWNKRRDDAAETDDEKDESPEKPETKDKARDFVADLFEAFREDDVSAGAEALKGFLDHCN